MAIMQRGTTFSLGVPTRDVYETLPVGIYQLQESTGQYYLEQQQNFKLPSKLYGDFKDIRRWKKSWDHMEKNMGIILTGLKGAGKTVEAQKFCIDMKLPVILITKPYSGPEFLEFITSEEFSNSIIFIDEFEKLYNDDKSAAGDFLTLLDGIFSTKLIFILTTNSMSISSFLKNRMGRIRYVKQYKNLPYNIVRTIAEDMLVNKEYVERVVNLFKNLGIITFDLVTNLIKEVNIHDEDPYTAIQHLNIEPEKEYYEIQEIVGSNIYKYGVQRISFITSGTILIDREDSKEWVKWYRELSEDEQDKVDVYHTIDFEECTIEHRENHVMIYDGDYIFKLIPEIYLPRSLYNYVY